MSDMVLSELKTLKDQTKYLMRHYPATRDNDFYLAIMWLKTFGKLSVKIPFIHWNEMSEIGGKMDDVVRMRRKIQNQDGELLPLNPEVLKKRQERAKHYRSAIVKA